VKVARRLFRFSVTDLFSLELVLEVDPVEGLVLQVLLRIPQLFYNREKQTTVIRDSIMVLTLRVSIMVLYNVVDPGPDRVGSASFCRIGDPYPGHAKPDPADPDH
jgi:hypothetical protein